MEFNSNNDSSFFLSSNNGFAMFVLLTNDDGIHSEGLWAAAEELRQDRRVTRLEIIAPQVQQSGVSHSITYPVSYTHLTLPTKA